MWWLNLEMWWLNLEICGVRRRGPENPCTVYIIYPCKFGGENPSNVFFYENVLIKLKYTYVSILRIFTFGSICSAPDG